MSIVPPDTRPIVLVVDDKPNMLRLMAKVLRDDARVRTAEGGEQAIGILQTEAVDVDQFRAAIERAEDALGLSG